MVEMQLWVTSKTMQVDWAMHYVQSLIKKKEWKFGKSHSVEKNHGQRVLYNEILIKSCYERTKGIGQEECVVSSANAVFLHSYATAIGSVLHWMAHLQCYVLITHSTVVNM